MISLAIEVNMSAKSNHCQYYFY